MANARILFYSFFSTCPRVHHHSDDSVLHVNCIHTQTLCHRRRASLFFQFNPIRSNERVFFHSCPFFDFFYPFSFVSLPLLLSIHVSKFFFSIYCANCFLKICYFQIIVPCWCISDSLFECNFNLTFSLDLLIVFILSVVSFITPSSYLCSHSILPLFCSLIFI